MPSKFRQLPGNRNHIILGTFSNADSQQRYLAGWPTERAVKANYDSGMQCGACSFFAPFDSDWGLCCHRESRHFTETTFEHFTCPHHDNEGWCAHSFQDRNQRMANRDLDDLPVLTSRGWRRAGKKSCKGGKRGDLDS